jgi:hypothetical protein
MMMQEAGRMADARVYKTGIRTRPLWALGLAVAIFSIAYTSYTLLRRSRLQLQLDISSSASSLSQLFFDTGSGYTEKESQAQTVRATSTHSFRRLVFDLPTKDLYSLRFDPLSVEGVVLLKNVRIVGSHGVLKTIPPSAIKAYNQIQTRTENGNEVSFKTVPGANDAGVVLDLNGPFASQHFEAAATRRSILAANAILVCVAVAASWMLTPLLWLWDMAAAQFRRADVWAQKLARSLSAPNFIQFDSYAMWFYFLCTTAFLLAVCADLNGSSAGIYNSAYGIGEANTLLLGVPRNIRSDEWAFHTPAILNESLATKRFNAQSSVVGDDSISLFANLPVRHVSTLLRPQFWGFFVLPADYGYSAYWQFKAFILVTGIFTFLLLTTSSTFWAITGSLWYFFSSFTQWTYSWPSALPEMVGLISWVLCLTCFLTIGQNRLGLVFAAIGTAACGIDFVLCGYPPHLIPLVWLAIFFLIFWCLGQRKLILRHEYRGRRILAFAIVLLIAGFIGATVYADCRNAIAAVANTAYPGRRVFAGGSMTLQMLISHFFELTETETHLPPSLLNICEGSGFLWLAPVTLFLWPRLTLSRLQKFFLASFCFTFIFILLWLLVHFSAHAGSFFGLNKTFGSRCIPCLGLVNIAIVAICMSAANEDKETTGGTRTLAATFFRVCGIVLIVFIVLFLTNQALAVYFSWRELSLATGFTSLLIVLLLERKHWALALTLILPQAVSFGAVNPIQRGLGVITQSTLYKFVHVHPELLRAKWIVYSDSPVVDSDRLMMSGYLTAVGCDVYTGIKYLPDVEHFPLFASQGISPDVLNRDGVRIARPLPSGTPSSAAAPVEYEVVWNISPSDPILKQLGVAYFAFNNQPPPLIASQLMPLTSEPVDGFWIYKAK